MLNPKKINKKWKSGARIDLRMHIRTWQAASPKHLYVQVNANKYDSDLPYAQDERNLAFNEQTDAAVIGQICAGVEVAKARRLLTFLLMSQS